MTKGKKEKKKAKKKEKNRNKKERPFGIICFIVLILIQFILI